MQDEVIAANAEHKFFVGDSRRARTSICTDSKNPQWNETFNILVADSEELVWLT